MSRKVVFWLALVALGNAAISAAVSYTLGKHAADAWWRDHTSGALATDGDGHLYICTVPANWTLVAGARRKP